MKMYTFPVWVKFGWGDYGNTSVEVSLTDEEAARLEAACADESLYYGSEGFESRDLLDIYNKVYNEAYDQVSCELDDDDDYEDAGSYEIGIKFPKCLAPK